MQNISTKSSIGFKFQPFCFILLLSCISFKSFCQFSSSKIIYTGQPCCEVPKLVDAGDINNDGYDDVVIVGEEVIYQLNDGTGDFPNTLRLPQSELFIEDIIIIDYNGDSYPDIVALEKPSPDPRQTCSLVVWENNEGEFLNPQTVITNIPNGRSLKGVDYDQNGTMDVSITSTSTYPMIVLNDGNLANWNLQDLFSTGEYGMYHIDFADFDKDGVLDVAGVNGTKLSINGQRLGLAGHVDIDFVEVSDINRDGNIDIVVQSSSDLVWMKNDGTGQFTRELIEGTSDKQFYAVEMVDLDADGDDDIITASWVPNRAGYIENLGNGNFDIYGNFSLVSVLDDRHLSLGDFDNDGIKDVLFSYQVLRNVRIRNGTVDQYSGIEAAFDVSTDNCINSDFNFLQASRGLDIVEWYWTFGDGAISYERNPVHRYVNPGNYTATLRVTNSDGVSDEETHDVEVYGLPPVQDDIEVKFCSSERFETLTVSLDSTYDYKWYRSATSTDLFYQGSSYTGSFTDATVFYVETINQNGCSANERFEISGSLFSYPNRPTVSQDVVSYSGPKDFTLTADVDEGTILWYYSLEDAEPFAQGKEIYHFFDQSTRIYLRSTNDAGCTSPYNFVDVTIRESPSRTPSFIWADPTQSDNKSNGRDLIKTFDNKYLALASSTSGNIIVGGDTLSNEQESHIIRHLITYNDLNEPDGVEPFVTGDVSSFGFSDRIFGDEQGNLYYANDVKGNSLQVGNGVVNLNTADDDYAVIVKMDVNRDIVWSKTMRIRNNFSPEFFFKDGSVYVRAYFGRSITVDGHTYNADVNSNYLAKIDENGSIEWLTTYPSLRGAMSISSQGEVIVAGSTINEYQIGDTTLYGSEDDRYVKVILQFDNQGILSEVRKLEVEIPSIISIEQVRHDSQDNFVIYGDGFTIGLMKFDHNLELIWDKYYNNTGQNVAINLELDDNDDIYLSGRYYEDINLGGVYVSSDDPSFDNHFFAKINQDGQTVWVHDAAISRVNAIAPHELGGMMIIGYFEDSVTLDELSFKSATESRSVDENIITAHLGFDRQADFQSSQQCDNSFFFQDKSRYANVEDIVEYNWNFGDGTSSTQPNASHVYDQFGSYNAVLQITDNEGSVKTASTTINYTVDNLTGMANILSDETSLCGGNVILEVDGEYLGYQWSNGMTTKSITTNRAGEYSVRTKLSTLCWSDFSEVVMITPDEKPDKPVVSTSDEVISCNGDIVTLTAPVGYSHYEWSNGETSNELGVTITGDYSVRVSNSGNCWSDFSDIIRVVFQETPDMPVVSAPDGTKNCSDSPLRLEAPEGYSRYEWSDNQTTRVIDATASGVYSVRVANENGCWSAFSVDLMVVVDSKPDQPSISDSDVVEICQGETVKLTAPVGYIYYEWSNEESTQEIEVGIGGNYSVRVSNSLECWSDFSPEVLVNVYELPAAPDISHDLLQKCYGDSILLTSAITYNDYLWSNGEKTDSIWVKESGLYTLQGINFNGCVSTSSSEVEVTINPLLDVSLEQVDNNLIASDGEGFNWFLDDELLSTNTQQIQISQSGVYQVEVFDENGCSNTSERKFFEAVVTSLSQEFKTKVSLYPNPITDDLLNISSIENGTNYIITSTLGKEALRGVIVNNRVDIGILKKGVYNILLIEKDQSHILRFVKQ